MAAGTEAECAGRRDREYRLLLTLALSKGLMSNILRPVLPVYAVVLGAPAAAVGFIVALPDLAQVVARIPAGALSGDIGRRGPLLACFVLATAGGVGLFLAGGYLALFPAQILWGLSVAAFWPTLWAYLMDVVSPAAQAGAIGIGLGMSGLGVLAGPLLGGVVADGFGWRAPFLMYTAMAAAGLMLTAALPRQPGGPWQKALAPKNLLHTYRRALPVGLRPAVFLASSSQFLAFALEGLQMAFLPLHLHGLGYTASMIGVVIATRKAAAAALRFAYPLVGRLASESRLAVLGLTLDILAVGAMAFLDRPLPLMAVGIISGIGVGIAEPAAKVLITGATASSDRALALGVEGTAANLGKSCGAIVLGAFTALLGLTGAYIAGCVAVAASAPGMVALYRANSRRAAQETRSVAAK
jgi:predicted MFS family arabinose efflux permease